MKRQVLYGALILSGLQDVVRRESERVAKRAVDLGILNKEDFAPLKRLRR